jgi:ACS family hexuronate transporter-like MFS transporter
MTRDGQLRWAAVAVLVLSSGLNYLDRMVFSALMPTFRREFGSGGYDLGLLVAAFSLPYAIASPFMGMLIDRVGLKWGAALVVGLWSAVGMGTGLVTGFASLLIARALLGFAEAGGVPATGKGFAMYLEPRNRAIGTGLNQVGITLGTMAAPLLTEFVSGRFGWRAAFVAAGAIGFLWIPLWLWMAAIPPAVSVQTDRQRVSMREILTDRRYIALVAANILAMTVYSLWFTWMTDFLVAQFGLTQKDANVGFAWVPPVFATLGGLFGGWLAHRMISKGGEVVRTRIRISLGASVLVLATAVAPSAGSPGLAVAAICVSLFFVTCMSVNYYAIPLDLFGAGRAAFAISFLTGAYGLMQTVLAPQIGAWSDKQGWQPVCAAIAVLPFISALVLRAGFRKS